MAVSRSIEIRRSLVLSSGHLTPEVATALAVGTFKMNETLEYGWSAYVGEDITDEDLDVTCINAAFALARKHDCTWIVWDRDGPTIAELPSYDW